MAGCQHGSSGCGPIAQLGDAVTPGLQVRIAATPLLLHEERRRLHHPSDCGGYVCFDGLVRDINGGQRVLRLDYETYDVLAIKEMRRIAEEAMERFGLRVVNAVHRKGSLAIGDTAVLVQVMSRHRREAFEGCRFVIDQIKRRVPIWKKEYYADGTTAWTQCHDHEEPHQHGSACGHD